MMLDILFCGGVREKQEQEKEEVAAFEVKVVVKVYAALVAHPS